MVCKRYTEEQIIAVPNEAEAGARIANLCREHGVSDATFDMSTRHTQLVGQFSSVCNCVCSLSPLPASGQRDWSYGSA